MVDSGFFGLKDHIDFKGRIWQDISLLKQKGQQTIYLQTSHSCFHYSPGSLYLQHQQRARSKQHLSTQFLGELGSSCRNTFQSPSPLLASGRGILLPSEEIELLLRELSLGHAISFCNCLLLPQGLLSLLLSQRILPLVLCPRKPCHTFQEASLVSKGSHLLQPV